MRHLEDDGFPPVGTYLQAGDHLYCTVNYKGEEHIEKYKDLSWLERLRRLVYAVGHRSDMLASGRRAGLCRASCQAGRLSCDWIAAMQARDSEAC